MSIIIGLNSFHADASAAIIKDDKLSFAIEEEKINRIKHWSGYPKLSIKECLDQTQTLPRDVTDIAINTNTYSNFGSKFFYFINNFLFGKKKIEIFNRTRKKLNIRKLLLETFDFNPKVKINFIDHHLSHIASAYYPSKFSKSLAISIDGFGDFASVVIAKCEGNDIKIIYKKLFPHSLGIFYETMTQALGFKNYGDEYKIMGLSSYGHPKYYELLLNNLFNNQNIFSLNLKYFRHTNKNFIYNSEGSPNQDLLYNNKLIELIGKDNLNKDKENIAASVQKIYEHFLFKIIDVGLKIYPSQNLCLTGGCALNSLANGKISEKSKVINIFIPYAPGDSGGAIGSALYVAKQKKPMVNVENLTNPYLGSNYDDAYCRKLIQQIDKNKLTVAEIKDQKVLVKIVAQNISQGKIVGWFQDSLEFGARALGNRSILADPRNPHIREIINSKIKKRESFRPFAPSIMEDYKDQWFNSNQSSVYMESVIKIKEEKIKIVPSVVHVDGTCRLQSVNNNSNRKFYNLIKAFFDITNVPIILNTSFNENEPIVNKPEEAIDCFLRTKMDMLIIGNFIIKRN
jgi:carbamoyltransferase